MRSKSGGGSSNVRREAGVSWRGVTRAAAGVVAARTALPGLPALRGGFVVFHFGKGWGWGREGQDPEGNGRPGALGSVFLDFERLPSRRRPLTIQLTAR